MIGTTAVTTIERFIIDQEHKYPEATGELSNLLYDIALGAKLIAAATRRAGLVNILGAMGNVNVQGEEQQKLDVFANEILKNALNHTGRVCVMASEEDDAPIPIPPEYPDHAQRWYPAFLMMRWPSGTNGHYTFSVEIFKQTGKHIALARSCLLTMPAKPCP